MDDPKIYTRAYSQSSAGRLVSAKGSKGDSLSHTELLDEFRNHADKWNREPTALVSVSDRIIDTVNRAFDKHFKDDESPADIWVVFIEVPVAMHGSEVHAAQLAEECGLREPALYYHEFVFEWAIPEEYVLHEVSLQTLMDRGLEWGQYLIQDGTEPQYVSTADLRCCIAENLQSRYGPWDVGVYLGFFGKTFGARAPIDWIAHQLFYDCVQTQLVEEDVVRLTYAHGHFEIVDLEFFSQLDDGIKTVLYDWWLADTDFLSKYKEFEEWRDVMEDMMDWDQIDIGYGKMYNEMWTDLSAKHEKIRAAIEEEAVILGL